MLVNQTEIVKDLENKRLLISRRFNAPLEKVWRAWTESELLDQWWAPRPWKAETKSFNFSNGGSWLYCMVGPEGERHWCRADFKNIDAPSSYGWDDAFTDENGVNNSDIPSMNWHCRFIADGMQARVEIEIKFQSVEALETIIGMGFQEGFSMAQGNLDEVLAG